MIVRPLIATLLFACMWDTDTIRMEREAFPGVHEVLAGKFTRHSRAYYGWRIIDRERRLQDSPDDVALLDDLAVAFDKTDRTEQAIALMRRSLANTPGRYETLANLGTFLIHGSKLEEGLGFIRKAIEVNPDAHFGREIVQAHLVEYVLAWRKAGQTGVPLRPDPEIDWSKRALDKELKQELGSMLKNGFAGFRGSQPELSGKDEDLVKGLIGMMFFGQHDHPVLAECLGDVLSQWALGHHRLACRAYLKASYNAPDEQAKKRYRELAKSAIGMQSRSGLRGELLHESVELEQVEEQFLDELEQGREFFEGIAANEAEWIKQGLDLDEEFARKYYAVGQTEDLSLPIEWESVLLWSALFGVVYLVIRRRQKSKATEQERRSRRKPRVIQPK